MPVLLVVGAVAVGRWEEIMRRTTLKMCRPEMDGWMDEWKEGVDGWMCI